MIFRIYIMAKIIFLYVCVLSNLLLAKGQTYTSVITTASGPVRGLISKSIENVDYAAFKGIPYAKPPVKELRFKPPVEPVAWTNVYDATKDGNICTQFNSYTDKTASGSEDCLYINVYTPHTTFGGSLSKPVIVWIHGGGYTVDNSRQATYGPDYIVGQDVILVTFNFRLGALGFLNLDIENATGNYGLKDQNLALKWVKKNIANFGGNPNSVTLAGQSSGASAVDFHVLSDMSTGLFKNTISMSGSALNLYWPFHTRADAAKQAFALGSKLGVNTSDKNVLLKALNDASAADIAVAGGSLGPIRFKPTLENPNLAKNQPKFLTTCSVTKYVNGNYTKGPHITGTTSQETLSILQVDFFLKLAELAVETVNNYKTLFVNITNASGGIANLSDDARAELIKESNDVLFTLGTDTKQKIISKNNNYPIYYYKFSFTPSSSSSNAKIQGASHSSDLPYLFYQPSANIPSSQTDVITTRKRVVKLYTNFAKYGNPTPNGTADEILRITWPDSRPNGEHLEIGKDLTTGSRVTDDFVNNLQSLGLGDSLTLNEC